jgi:iron complex outermembrane receptor protein
MKKIIFILINLLIVSMASATNTDKLYTSLKGKITDKNNEPLVGVNIYFPEIKTGANTDNNGNYSLNNLPKRTLLVQLTALGYKMIAVNIDLSSVSERNFVMEETIVEINEVIITGQSAATQLTKMPTPISIITKTDLHQQASTNIIDAISHQPGISQITTGSGISKPIIRGLGYNRVVVVNNGVRQEGQQWGDEHGIEIDENDISRVEILKGPASLMYGSDAMAGVINLFSDPVLSQGKIRLNALANYQTNNGLMVYSLNFLWLKYN